MAIFRAFFIGVLCWTVCMPVFGDEGGVASTLSGETLEKKTGNDPVPPVNGGLDGGNMTDAQGVDEQRQLSGSGTEANIEKSEKKSLADETPDQADDKMQAAGDKYKAAKEKEQSLANRMVSGVSMAATGIGGMELAQGLSEQKADKDAEADMSRYIETFQCRIGEQGAKINGGDTNISTPGANQLINLYQEYVNLAADLRERKQALGMRAGIESEVILDKASTGLYDDKGTGIENGTYASLYRASQGNQQDADKLSAQQDASKKRVIGGAVAAGAGVVVGALGDSLVNGKLGELIKDAKDKKVKSKENESVVAELKKGLTSAGFTNVDKLDFSNLDLSGLSGKLQDIDWSQVKASNDQEDATKILNTTNAKSFTSSLGTMLGQPKR